MNEKKMKKQITITENEIKQINEIMKKPLELPIILDFSEKIYNINETVLKSLKQSLQNYIKAINYTIGLQKQLEKLENDTIEWLIKRLPELKK